MACNANLVIMKLRKGLYANPPVIQAKNRKEVIEKTINYRKYRNLVKKQRKWIEKYFSYDSVKRKIGELLLEIENE
jgi:hypothetical protein